MVEGSMLRLSIMDELTKQKLALFMIVRNTMVMGKGLKLGKSMDEINKMTLETIDEIMEMIDFKEIEKEYLSALSNQTKN